MAGGRDELGVAKAGRSASGPRSLPRRVPGGVSGRRGGCRAAAAEKISRHQLRVVEVDEAGVGGVGVLGEAARRPSG